MFFSAKLKHYKIFTLAFPLHIYTVVLTQTVILTQKTKHHISPVKWTGQEPIFRIIFSISAVYKMAHIGASDHNTLPNMCDISLCGNSVCRI